MVASASRKQWEGFRSPETIRKRLIAVSMYVTAFDMLQNAIVERVKGFYADGLGLDGPVPDPKYRTRVLSRNTSPLYASLDWLFEYGVIEEADLASFAVVENTRNTLARELPSIVLGENSVRVAEHLELLGALLGKIERWWAINIEIPAHPDFDGSEIDVDQLVPGSVLMLQMMLEVISGNEELLSHGRRFAGSLADKD